MKNTQKVCHVTLVDDDPDDRVLFKEVLAEIDPALQVMVYGDCTEVLAGWNTIQTNLLFLDINLPIVDGFSCLQFLADAHRQPDVPVVMYSSSGNQKDINASYGLGAALYVQKATSFALMRSSLMALLLLDWSDPEPITFGHFRNGHYHSFQAGARENIEDTERVAQVR